MKDLSLKCNKKLLYRSTKCLAFYPGNGIYQTIIYTAAFESTDRWEHRFETSVIKFWWEVICDAILVFGAFESDFYCQQEAKVGEVDRKMM